MLTSLQMTPVKTTFVELSPPVNQREWGWPAIVNFSLASAGAGYHIIGFLITLLEEGAAAGANALFLEWLGPMMVTFGLMVLALESGRPSRSFYLMRHFRQSWISRELIFYVIFLLAALGGLVSPSLVMRLLAVAGAVGLLVSHGFVVYDSKAVTAWNRPAVHLVFICAGITSGAAVGLLLFPLHPLPLSLTGRLVLWGIAANAGAWLLYLFISGKSDAAFRSATRTLRRPASLAAILGAGHILPFLLILALLSVRPGLHTVRNGNPLAVLSALLILFGTILQKIALLRMASGKRSLGFNYSPIQPSGKR
jgi:DMSO reductase anchor subunit